jgi:hypothetical protein
VCEEEERGKRYRERDNPRTRIRGTEQENWSIEAEDIGLEGAKVGVPGRRRGEAAAVGDIASHVYSIPKEANARLQAFAA